MEKVGRIIEDILRYIKEKRNVKREDIKDKFELDEKKIEEILKFLLNLKLLSMNNLIMITESGLEFLEL